MGAFLASDDLALMPRAVRRRSTSPLPAAATWSTSCHSAASTSS